MSVIQAGNTTTTSLIYTGDTTGNLVFTTGGANTVALTIDSTQNITTTNKFAAASMPSGSILQVVGTSSTTNNNTTSTSYVASSLSQSITPKFSNSKILILINCQGMVSGSAVQLFYTIYRNSTDLGNTTGSVGMGTMYTASGGLTQMPVMVSYLDSPATTSAITYALYYRVNTGTGTIANNNCTGSITLMEIAG